MKKILLASAVALFGLANAQEKGNFKIGAHIGVPTGDFSKAYSFNLGFDAAYVYPIAENFKLGVTTGYSHYFGKKMEFELFGFNFGEEKNPDGGIIPLAATAQYTFGESKVFLGADLGYAFFTGKEASGGGFYIQPKVGYTFADKHDLYISYKNISNNGSIGSVNLGYGFNF